jgi:hypothetical protein
VKTKGLSVLIITIIGAIVGYSLYAGQNEYEKVDLSHLVAHIDEYENKRIEVVGIVRYRFSHYMWEDFWLELDGAEIPVKVYPLERPPDGVSIVLRGIIRWNPLEGGFYYIDADSWKIR